MRGTTTSPLTGLAPTLLTVLLVLDVCGRSAYYARAGIPSVRGKDTCVFCFDFDGTIRLFNGAIAPDIYDIAAQLLISNFAYGITTANCAVDNVKFDLYTYVSAETFNSPLLNSNVAQYCDPNKGNEAHVVMSYYHSTPRCTVVFDDTPENVHSIQSYGIKYQAVQRLQGVSWDDFTRAIDRLRADGCDC